MQQALHRSSLVRRGCVAEGAHYEGDKAVIAGPGVRKRWSMSIVRYSFSTCS